MGTSAILPKTLAPGAKNPQSDKFIDRIVIYGQDLGRRVGIYFAAPPRESKPCRLDSRDVLFNADGTWRSWRAPAALP